MVPVQKLATLKKLLELLTNPPDFDTLRLRSGETFLELFDADYFASFVWNHKEQQYVNGLMLNMSAENFDRYEEYFQYRDPITPGLQRRRKATDVGHVMSYNNLRKTEFYNDFLRVDGLYHGINGHAFDGKQHMGDIRIWRARHRRPFDTNTLELLEFVRPLYGNALKNAVPSQSSKTCHQDSIGEMMSRFSFTRREAEIAQELGQALTDQQISDALAISCSTVRTLLKNIYRKLNVHSRSAVLARLHN